MSPEPQTSAERRAEIDAWFALILRILGALFGLGIIGYLTVIPTPYLTASDRGLLIAVAVVCLGPVFVAGLAQLIQAWRGGHSE